MIAVVAALPEEARALRRRLRRRHVLGLAHGRATIGLLGDQEIALTVSGDGAERARVGLQELLAVAPVVGVIGIGFCGAISAGLEIGSLVVGREISGDADPHPPPHPPWVARAAALGAATEVTIATVPSLLLTPAHKAAALRRAPPGLAVADLESAAWGATAAHASLPFLILRVVSDTADEALPPVLGRSLCPDGSVDRLRVLRNALMRPGSLPALLRLAGRARRGACLLADALESIATATPSLEHTASLGS